VLPSLKVLQYNGLPILEQLRLEEALLRTDSYNYCIINQSSPPAIVMGISGKAERMVHMDLLCAKNIPLIKRFSGGGTVFTDENTVFITFIMQADTLPLSPYPEHVMKWSGDFYTRALSLPEFRLHENDYIIGSKKCGGNAQYFCKGRWLHHSSFLWDYDPMNMLLLQHPPKMPNYRHNRPHHEFLSSLKKYFPQKIDFIQSVLSELQKVFNLDLDSGKEDFSNILQREHRKATVLLNEMELV